MLEISREVGVCSLYEILIIILIIVSREIIFLISNSGIFLCDELFVADREDTVHIFMESVGQLYVVHSVPGTLCSCSCWCCCSEEILIETVQIVFAVVVIDRNHVRISEDVSDHPTIIVHHERTVVQYCFKWFD